MREYGCSEGCVLYDLVAPNLGASVTDPDSVGVNPVYTREFRAMVDSYCNRVRRAADALTAEGSLIKVGRGQVLPSGASIGNASWYYTPQAYEAALSQRRAQRLRQEQEDARWADVRETLMRHGYTMDDSHRLPLGEWEKLLSATRLQEH